MTEKTYTLDDVKQFLLNETIKTHAYAKEHNADCLAKDDVMMDYFDWYGLHGLSYLLTFADKHEDAGTAHAICVAMNLYNLIHFNKNEILAYIKENLPKEEK